MTRLVAIDDDEDDGDKDRGQGVFPTRVVPTYPYAESYLTHHMTPFLFLLAPRTAFVHS